MSKTLHVKKGDTVKIIAGNEKPRKVKGERIVKTGKVTSVDVDSSTVVVENANLGIKHKKAKNAQSQGGRLTLAMPIHSSNVMVICPDCNTATRINYKITEEEGKKIKVRVCKKCGAVLDTKVESVKAKKEKKEKDKALKKEKKEKDKKEKAEKTEKAEKKAEEKAKKEKKTDKPAE